MTTYRLSGRIVEEHSERGIPGTRVEVWDSEALTTDLLAFAVGDGDGAFSLTLTEDYLDQHLHGRRPALELRCFSSDRELSAHRSLWTLTRRDTVLRIEAKPEAPPSPRSPTASKVRGLLRDTQGRPVEDATIQAYDRGLSGDLLLGTGHTDSAGRYEISYTSLHRPDKYHPDLFLVASTRHGQTIASSERVCQAPATATVDLVAGAAFRGPSELATLEASIGPHIHDFALAGATSTQIDWLACSSVSPREQIEARVAAELIAHDTRLPMDVLYGLIRNGLPSTRRELLLSRPADLRRALTAAADDNIIELAHSKIEASLTQIRKCTIALAFEAPEPGATGNLGDLLAIALPGQAAREELLDRYLQHTGTPEQFWSSLAKQPSFQGAGVIAQIQLVLQLAALTRSHFPLIEELWARKQKNQITGLKDLAGYSEGDWIKILKIHHGNHAIGYPADTPGANAAEKRTNYARVLRRAMEAAFPTAALAASVAQEGVDPLTTFFTNNASFEIGKTRVGDYLAQHPGALAGIQDPKAATSRLKTIERLSRVTPRYEEMKVLLDDGLSSSRAIARVGRTRFLAKYQAPLGGEAIAANLFDNAAAVTQQALALHAKLGAAYNPRSAYVLPDLVTLTAPKPAAFADFATLFGSPDACTCEHCASVIGPAAYFVDVLHFLDRYDSKITKSGSTKWTAKDVLLGSVPGTSPALPGRRPDLGQIDLTCDNTDTPLPYVDLVNEILAYSVASLNQPPTPVIPDHLATVGTAAELAAMPNPPQYKPQNAPLQDEGAWFALAYNTLSTSLYPWAAPYHFRLDEARVYLKHLGVPRHALMWSLRTNTPGGVDMPAIHGERLGLSPLERQVISGATSVPMNVAWDAIAHPPPGALPGALLKVPELLKRSGMTYDELLDLIDTSCLARFGTPMLAPAGSCNIDEQTLNGLSDINGALDMTHRFMRLVRRIGWTIRELDQVLAAFTPSGTQVLSEQAVGLLSVLTLIRADRELPTPVLASWFGPLDIQRRDGGNTPSFYEQLFQNKAVTNPVDPGLAVTSVQGLTTAKLLSDHGPAILAGLRMSKEELSLLTEDYGLSLPILVPQNSVAPAPEGLAMLHRVITLCRAVRLSVRDFLSIYDLSFEKPFDPGAPENTLRFLEIVEFVRGSGHSPTDLEYVFRGQVLPETALAPTDAVIDSLLDPLFAALVALRGKNGGPDPVAEQALVEDKLASALKIDAATAHTLLADILTTDGTHPLAGAFMLPDALPEPPPDPMILDALGLRDAQRAAYRHLDKAATLVRRHGLRSDELSALFRPAATSILDLDALPRAPISGAASPLFAACRNLVALVGLRSIVKGNDPSLAALMTSDAAQLAAALGWPQEDTVTLLSGQQLTLSSSDAATQATSILRLRDAVAALRRLGVSASQVLGTGQSPGWMDPADAHSAEIAEAIVRTAKAKYAEEDWNRVAPPLRDELRERLRATMVAYLVAKNGYEDSDDLFANLLIDVETTPAVYTSRLKQAIGSVQTFVQRVLLNLEAQTVTLPEEAAQEWIWRKSYRIWEANRKVFLHPEAYLDPSLRTDKSPFFKTLEAALRQKDIDDDAAEAAFEAYLDKLDEVSNLDAVAMWHQKEDGDDTHLPIDLLHIVGRTRLTPYKHFYRTRVDGASWTPWEPIDLDIDAEQVLLVVDDRRPHLFWPIFDERPDEVQAIPQNQNTPGEPAATHLEIRMAWSELRAGRWTARRISIGFVPSAVTSDADRLSFVPQRIGDGPLRIDCFLWGHTLLGCFTRSGCGEIEGAARTNAEPGVYYLAEPQHTLLAGQFDTFQSWPPQQLVLPFMLDEFPGNLPLLGATPATFRVLVPHFLEALAAKDADTARRGADLFFYKDGRTNLFAELVVKTHTEWYLGSKATPAGNPWNDVDAGDVVLGRDDVQSGLGGLIVWAQTKPEETYFPHVYEDAKRYRFHAFYHPHVCSFRRELQRAGVDGLLKWSLNEGDPLQLRQNIFFPSYQPDPVNVLKPYPVEDVDFSFGGAYSLYNWELFFHAPFLIALRLMQNGRHEEAQRWFHFIFDPTTGEQGKAPRRFWKVRPFRENLDLASVEDELAHLAADQQSPLTKLIDAILKLDDTSPEKSDFSAQIDAWRKHPFDPHFIARMRPIAYQKAVVMKYIENLIAWGDQLFRRETLEAINEATQLYILAHHLLGRRPQRVRPPQDKAPMNYRQLEKLGLGDFSDPLVGASPLVEAESLGGGPAVNPPFHPILEAPPDFGTLYFCVPGDESLAVLWDTVADRLFKIRHSLDIEGTFRRLPLFEPPIDPMLLVQATALGVDLAAAISGGSTSLSAYRFPVLHGKAMEMCGAVAGLGAALLGALEKKDAETLAKLRGTQEIELLQLIREVKAQQVKEAEASLDALGRSYEAAKIRRDYYVSLPKISDAEQAALFMNVLGIELGIVAQAISAVAPTVEAIPPVTIGGAGMMGSPLTTTTFGGQASGAPIEAAGHALGMAASLLRDGSQVAATLAGYERRAEEWKLQERLAGKDMQQIEKQIAAAKIRVAVTTMELSNHERQMEHAQQVFAFIRDKRTNEELYDWMVAELATVHHETYTLAYDLAKRAEDVFRFELAVKDGEPRMVTFGHWDNLKQGLLAGERLQRDLRRLESAYLERTSRDLELTKHVSLAEVAPDKLMELRETGATTLHLGEEIFDGDYPGHYLRRIKSLAITVPTVAGAYAGVNCTLSLSGSSIRKDGTGTSQDYADGGHFRGDLVPVTRSIVTSSGVSDAGLFEPNLRDERYLPFEGAGVIGDYAIVLPIETNRFDVAAVNDVILHVRYTARSGGDALANAARGYYANSSPKHYRLLSLRSELSMAWESFMTAPAKLGDPQVLSIPLAPGMFPFTPSTKQVALKNVTLYAQWSGKVPYTDGSALTMKLNRPGAGEEIQSLAGFPDNMSRSTGKGSTIDASATPDLVPWTLIADSTDVALLAPELRTNNRLDDTLRDVLMLCEYDLVPASP